MYRTIDPAVALAEQGFRVLPLRPWTKVPDLRHWPDQASSDAATVRRYFEAAHARHGAYPNVGICTGGLAGAELVVLDVDTKHGGQMPKWAAARPTLTALTPSGGFHLYYRVTDGTLVPNSVSRLAPGIDVRGQRGQVAAPPSQLMVGAVKGDPNQAGRPEAYRWLDAAAELATVPGTLLVPDDLKSAPTGLKRARWDHADPPDAVPVGERNDYLTSLAGWLFRHTEDDRAGVLAQLLQEVKRLGFSPRTGEVESIVRSIARNHG